MSKKRLFIGAFFYANHVENNISYRHPFLVIAIGKNKVIALQFTSVIIKDGQLKSYFGNVLEKTISSSKEEHLIDLDINDGLKNWSQANLNKLKIFDFNHEYIHKFSVFSVCKKDKYKEILEHIKSKDWDSELIYQILF